MIRRILLIFCIGYLIIWFAASLIIKGEVIKLIKNLESDNMAISYNSVQFSGFPFDFTVKITDPRISLIQHNNIMEISMNNADINLNYAINSFSLNLGRNIHISEWQNSQKNEYQIHASIPIIFNFALKESLLFGQNNQHQNPIQYLFQKTSIQHDNIQISKNGDENLQLKNLDFIMNKGLLAEQQNKNFIFVQFDYSGNFDYIPFSEFSFNIKMDYNKELFSDAAEDTSHGINISDMQLKIGNAELNSNGYLNFINKSLQQADINYYIVNYQNIRKILKNESRFINFLPAMDDIAIRSSKDTIDNIQSLKFSLKFDANGFRIE